MRKAVFTAVAGLLAGASPLLAQMPREAMSNSSELSEWAVEWGGRTRDPYVAPNGDVWFVGQQGNYVARFSPTTQEFQRYEIDEGTNPHNLIVAEDGHVWYAGNRNGRIGQLDPATGEIVTHMMPDPEAVRDPHTLIFDGRGNIWFTAQGAAKLGRLNMETGAIDIIDSPAGEGSRPYGIIVDPDGTPWANLFGTNLIAEINPQTLEVTTHPVGVEGETRNRRIARTPDGMIYYTDYSRGYLGRLNPETGETSEWAMPGGAESSPYAVTADGQGRLWVTETGPQKRLIGFNPATEEFFSVNEVSGNIRHMMYDDDTGTMWFGTDANQVGRIVTRNIMP